MKKRHLEPREMSSDEDSDTERNFTLFTERGSAQCDEDEVEDNSEEEDEESGDVDDEEESGDVDDEEEPGDVDDEEEPGDVAGSSEIQTEEDMKRELSSMSFEDIMKLQKTVGTKVYSEVAYGSKRKTEGSRKKRLNKNRPSEVSSKRPAPFLRQVTSVRKPTQRDPRFDDLSGEYKAEIFDKTYRFMENIKSREKQMIQKQLRRTKKNSQRKDKLQFLLERMENQEREKKNREQQREREIQFKKQQRERANQGARPFFIKNSEKRKLQLADKYQELKRSGKLESFLSKKRRRNAVKDRRKLPRNTAGVPGK